MQPVNYSTLPLLLAALIAFLTCHLALDLASRIRSARFRWMWLAASAVTMGGGTWSVHFIAIMGLAQAPEFSFYTAPTVASLILVVMGATAGFMTLNRNSPTARDHMLGAAFMSLGLVGMNYIGLEALNVPGSIDYDSRLLMLALVSSFFLCTVCFLLYFRTPRLAVRLTAAAVLAIALCAVHSIGIQAINLAELCSDKVIIQPINRPYILTQNHMILAVSAVTVLILLIGFAASMFDRRTAMVAEREAATLRLSEEHFRMLYQRAPTPLYAVDRHGAIEEVSDLWVALLGYPREQAVGRQVTAFMTPDSGRARMDAAAASREGESECQFVKMSGEIIDTVVTTVTERDSSGNLVRSYEGLVDVTARKRAEDALRQAQKMEAVGQLTGGIAHDFNNLLMVITSNLELAQGHLSKDRTERAAASIENALSASFRAAALTQRLLAFSRRQSLMPVAIDPEKLVVGMLDLFRRSLGENIAINTRFANGLWKTRADANQLENCLLNLAINARDAMPDGGTLTIAAENATLPANGDVTGGDYVRVIVSDTGSGMPPNVLARVFEPFYTTKGIGKGSGLGLSQVFGFARQSGGDVRISSAVGKGTDIGLFLPRLATDDSADGSTGTEMPVPIAHRAETILVVEDEEEVRACTSEILADLGYIVLEAEDAQNALAALEANPEISVMMTDIGLPGMDGRKLAEAAVARHPGLRVIFATGYARYAVDAEMDESLLLLNKPFRAADLASTVRRAFDSVQS